MDAIRNAIRDLKFTIPRALLDKAFVNRFSGWRQQTQVDLDSQLLNLVIKPRVLVDCDLVGGTQITVPLEGLDFQITETGTTVVRIPKSRTDGRSIVSVLHVSYMSSTNVAAIATTYGSTGTQSYNPTENSALMGATAALMNSHDKIPITSTANVRLIAENVVMFRDVFTPSANAFLRCVVANDENLNNIQIRSYPHFAKLVGFAVKSYIYNTLIIEIDQAELQGGAALGMFKTILEGYSDSEQNYQDFLSETWQRVAFMNDQETHHRYLKLLTGGMR